MPTSPFLSDWQLIETPPGQWRDASALDPGAAWLPALVPGTVGGSLRAVDRWAPDNDVGFDSADFWYRAELEGHGPALLRFEGLATIAEIYLDEVEILRSENMFLAHEIEVTLSGRHRLAIAFRSLEAWAGSKKGRARWRPRLIRPPNLRFARTLLLGHIPGWGPPVHAVGPWRDVTVRPATDQRLCVDLMNTWVDREGDGYLEIAIHFAQPVVGWVTARCGSVDFALADDGDGLLRGRVEIPDVRVWWPHTHGSPHLYDLSIYAGADVFPLGKVGFRTIELDRGHDGKGFGLTVNGVPVFCRGACWTSADIVSLPSTRDAYLPLLTLARDAGMNMIRIGGTMGYEGDAFYALCDELGLLVWQDFAFANFDYPVADPTFSASVESEARQFLRRRLGSPSLAVLCGASEVAQQAAMLGMPPACWSSPFFDTMLAEVARDLRPDVVYGPHTPWGGDMPFVANEGISHYYGVSAHRRPIEDARRADVRFSAESLGFANVPDVAPFALEPDRAAVVHPNFTERFAHDVAASWAFEGIRNHYTQHLYAIDVETLRRDEPDRFLDFARATSAEVMEATFAEWRREGSSTQGALVWFLRDLFPGAGWGVIDCCGEPKAAYFGLQRAFRPLTVILTDEALNGLKISLLNETAAAREVRLSLECLREGEVRVIHATIDLVLAPHTTRALAATSLWGGFFDTTYAFRFGEPSHDVTIATLTDLDGRFITEAFHFPLGRGHARYDLGLFATLLSDPAGAWALELRTKRLAQSVAIACPGYRPQENWFHLPPGAVRRIPLAPIGVSEKRPQGHVRALNGLTASPFA